MKRVFQFALAPDEMPLDDVSDTRTLRLEAPGTERIGAELQVDQSRPHEALLTLEFGDGFELVGTAPGGKGCSLELRSPDGMRNLGMVLLQIAAEAESRDLLNALRARRLPEPPQG